MPLLKCPDCNSFVSDKAAYCIKCGCPIKYIIESNKKLCAAVNPEAISRILPPDNIINAQNFIDATIDFTKKYLARYPAPLDASLEKIYSYLLLYDVHNELLHEGKLNNILGGIISFLFKTNYLKDNDCMYLLYLTGVIFFRGISVDINYKLALDAFEECLKIKCDSDIAILMKIEDSGFIKSYTISTESILKKANDYISYIKLSTETRTNAPPPTKSNNSPRTVAKNRTASTYANNSYSFELDYDESEEEAEIYYAEINKEKIDYADCFERSNETGWFYPDDDDEEYDTETELYDPFTDEFLDEMEY